MKSNKQMLIAALISMGFGAAAVAQDAAPEKELAVLPQFEAVDANEDGMIDQAEGESLSEVLEQEHEIVFQFEAVDQTRDGLIDFEEYVAYDAALQERLGIV